MSVQRPVEEGRSTATPSSPGPHPKGENPVLITLLPTRLRGFSATCTTVQVGPSLAYLLLFTPLVSIISIPPFIHSISCSVCLWWCCYSAHFERKRSEPYSRPKSSPLWNIPLMSQLIVCGSGVTSLTVPVKMDGAMIAGDTP